jgi:hypothetical protein
MSVFADPRDEGRALLELVSDGEHPIELRYRDSEGRWHKRFADTPAEADEAASRLTRHADVFVGVLPRLGRSGEDERRYAPSRVLWCDCDSVRSVGKLMMFEPTPTAIVHSGGVDGDTPKCHGYWALTAPLAANEVERHALRLVHHFESDPAVAEPARVMRLPGSRSFKTGRIARLERFTGEVHAIGDVTGGLEDAPTSKSTAGRGEYQSPAALVPWHERHPVLKAFAVHLVRGGITDEACILSHLWHEFARSCEPLPEPEPGSIEALAAWASRSRIADRERTYAAWLREHPDWLAPWDRGTP